MKVVLLHDAVGEGSSADELDVLAQMEAIECALSELGHAHERLAFSLNLEAAANSLRDLRPTVVFNLVESVGGQGRLVHLAPALLESLRIPFTGCGSDATYTSANKILSKRLMRAAGIATPDWHTREDLARGAPIKPGRWIIKSVWEHASRGLDESSVVETGTARDLLHALERRWESLGGEGFVEAYIEGREFNLSMLCGQRPSRTIEHTTVLPPAEIVFEGFGQRTKVVSYKAKWDEGSFEYQNTPRRFDHGEEDLGLLEQLKREAQRSWTAFGLSGYARVDFRVDEQGIPWVLEVNSNPCLSKDAGFAAAVQQSGLTYTRGIERILDAAIEQAEPPS